MLYPLYIDNVTFFDRFLLQKFKMLCPLQRLYYWYYFIHFFDRFSTFIHFFLIGSFFNFCIYFFPRPAQAQLSGGASADASAVSAAVLVLQLHRAGPAGRTPVCADQKRVGIHRADHLDGAHPRLLEFAVHDLCAEVSGLYNFFIFLFYQPIKIGVGAVFGSARIYEIRNCTD